MSNMKIAIFSKIKSKMKNLSVNIVQLKFVANVSKIVDKNADKKAREESA